MAEYDAPLPILEAVALTGPECPLLPFTFDLAAHVLEIDRECEVSRDTGQEVLEVESSEVEMLRGPALPRTGFETPSRAPPHPAPIARCCRPWCSGTSSRPLSRRGGR